MQVPGRRWRSAALAAVAATALAAGCGVHPGTAAVVDGTTISHDRVDEVAQAVCSANLTSAQANNQPLPTLATRGAREVALQILVESELSKQFGEAKGVQASRREISQAVAQNETGIAMLPEDQQDDFRTALREYAEGQLILIEVGRESLGGEVADDQAIAEGSRLRSEFVETLDVEIDPRYGHFEDGAFRRGGTSLSVPASEEALQGARPQPGEAYVGSLPASQQCR